MDLTLLQKTLDESGIAGAIKSVCTSKTECYLVGGAVRDGIQGRALNDFDFCFPDNPEDYAEQIASHLGATWFILDKERKHSRLVFKLNDRKFSCDFAPFRAPSLESDLHKRDFTINAMAVPVCGSDFRLIDPLNGQADLAAKVLRSCSEYSFQDDPLRCLKGIRHAVSMNLDFEPMTMGWLIDAVPQIDQVASERIRTELSRAVASDNAEKTFALLGKTGLLRELFGPSAADSFAEALSFLHDLDAVIKALKAGACGRLIRDYLVESCEEHVTIDVALKLAAFFLGYRPVALKSVMNALRFSKRTIILVEQLQNLRNRVDESRDRVANKARSRARWLSSLGQEALASAVFLPLVSSGSIQENLLQSELLIDSYASCSVDGKLVELVDGDWLSEALRIAEGPEIGRLQALVHQAEISGEVTTKSEAQQWLLVGKKSIDNEIP